MKDLLKSRKAFLIINLIACITVIAVLADSSVRRGYVGGETVTVTVTNTITSSIGQPNVPAIPGFPWQSILIGIFVASCALVLKRRRAARQ